MGDQLDSDIARIGVNEEDLSIDIVSNAEDVGFPSITKDNVEHNDASPHMKRLPVGHDAVEDTKQGSTFVKFNEQNYFTVLALKRPFFFWLNQTWEAQIFQILFRLFVLYVVGSNSS